MGEAIGQNKRGSVNDELQRVWVTRGEGVITKGCDTGTGGGSVGPALLQLLSPPGREHVEGTGRLQHSPTCLCRQSVPGDAPGTVPALSPRAGDTPAP